MNQTEAIELIESGKNVFLTGGAGRGKSWVIRQITNDRTVLVAPTGIAALNIGGVTCNSAFGIPPSFPEAKDWTSVSQRCAATFGKNSNVERIVIDEIGMCSSMMLDLIDAKLRIARGQPMLPFGGIQVIVVGDFYQLEPIVSQRDSKFFYQEYDLHYAFAAESWNFEIANLVECKRQDNKRQVKMLDAIREGKESAGAALHFIQREAKEYSYDEDTLHLCALKADAAQINKYWFDRIREPMQSFAATIEGDRRVKWNDAPVGESVQLKVGCKVVCAANCPEGQYVNGNHGTVLSFVGAYKVLVLLDNGEEVIVEPFTWDKYRLSNGLGGIKKEPIASFTQIPLKLGYAVTAHASQGCTLEGAAIDVGRGCFSAGQLYMMLSRVTDLRNLSFSKKVSDRNIIVSDEVNFFYETGSWDKEAYEAWVKEQN